MSKFRFAMATIAAAMLVCGSPCPAAAGDAEAMNGTNDTSIYDFKMKTIDGKEMALSKYKGDVLLIVNVASK